jgi:hypothetical protein
VSRHPFRPHLEPLDDRRLPSLTLGGSYSLDNGVDSGSPGQGKAVAVGDFDGDGHPDLAVMTTEFASGYNGAPDLTYTAVEVLRGRGDGSFDLPRVVYVTDRNAFGFLRAGDVNGDDRSDLVMGDYSEPITLLGNVDGSFTLADSYPYPEGPVAPDLNGDGYADSVWIAYPPPRIPGWSGTLAVSLGRADGTLWPPIYFQADWAMVAGVGDFNEDGRLDVAVASRVNTVTVWLNDGNWPAKVAPTVYVSDATAVEGRGKNTVLTFTVTLSAPSAEPVTVSYRTADGTATTADNDYVAKTGTITFAPGETTKTITIEVKGDRKKEANEYFYLDLFGNISNSVFGKNRGIGTILNDD